MAPTALWGSAGGELEERAADAAHPSQLLVAWLARRAADAERPDAAVLAAAAMLERSPRMHEVAAALGFSERHLRRRVTADVGYGPKRLGRVLRLQRAPALVRGGLVDLAAVAVAAGYADQAHFTRECTALAGVPPGALLVAA